MLSLDKYCTNLLLCVKTLKFRVLHFILGEFDSFSGVLRALRFSCMRFLEIVPLIFFTMHDIDFWRVAEFFQQNEEAAKNYSIEL